MLPAFEVWKFVVNTACCAGDKAVDVMGGAILVFAEVILLYYDVTF
jgi:hypothetical protein